MRNAIFGRIAALPLFVGMFGSAAHAQASSEPTSAFCAFAGLDLLQALDGTWTIRQGRGQARAGIMTVPLPSPPATTVTFRFDLQRRLINVRGANLEDEMVLFATAPMQQQAANGLVGEPPTLNRTAPVCEWLSAPTLIGTNGYFFLDGEAFAIMQSRTTPAYCQAIKDGIDGKSNAYLAADANGSEPQPKAKLQKFWDLNCRQPPIEPDHVDMDMTLVLRFTSANSGSGMLYFQGGTNQSKFRASAPVTISR